MKNCDGNRCLGWENPVALLLKRTLDAGGISGRCSPPTLPPYSSAMSASRLKKSVSPPAPDGYLVFLASVSKRLYQASFVSPILSHAAAELQRPEVNSAVARNIALRSYLAGGDNGPAVGPQINFKCPDR